MSNPIEITDFIGDTFRARVNGEEFAVDIPRDDKGKLQYDLAKASVALDPAQLREAVEFASLITVSKVKRGPDATNKSIVETIFKQKGKLYGIRHLEKVEGGHAIEHASLNKNGEVIWAVRAQGSGWESIGEAA